MGIQVYQRWQTSLSKINTKKIKQTHKFGDYITKGTAPTKQIKHSDFHIIIDRSRINSGPIYDNLIAIQAIKRKVEKILVKANYMKFI
jgi:hypothetical protein